MKYYHVLEWMKAVGDDPAKQKMASKILEGLPITYAQWVSGAYEEISANIVRIDFGKLKIEYKDNFDVTRIWNGDFDIRNYNPRFVGEPPALPE